MKVEKLKIGKYTFFEEVWELKEIFSLLNLRIRWNDKLEKLKILDLGCWNWRHKILINDILNSSKNNFIYYWIDNTFYKNQNCDVFFDWEILEIVKKLNNNFSFDLIIANWIFENNLSFEIETLNVIFTLLNKKWLVYLNFWNFWKDNLYRSDDLEKVKKYVKNNFLSKIIKSKFWNNFKISYFKKQKNEWFNISIILSKIDFM